MYIAARYYIPPGLAYWQRRDNYKNVPSINQSYYSATRMLSANFESNISDSIVYVNVNTIINSITASMLLFKHQEENIQLEKNHSPTTPKSTLKMLWENQLKVGDHKN